MRPLNGFCTVSEFRPVSNVCRFYSLDVAFQTETANASLRREFLHWFCSVNITE